MLVLVRGLPGSGKSTLATSARFAGFHHFEADMYFVFDGIYNFNPAKLKSAHRLCQNLTKHYIETNDHVIVSNTFVTWKELVPYVEIACDHDVALHIIEMTDNYGSIHNVPEENINKMRARWQNRDTIVTCIKEHGFKDTHFSYEVYHAS